MAVISEMPLLSKEVRAVLSSPGDEEAGGRGCCCCCCCCVNGTQVKEGNGRVFFLEDGKGEKMVGAKRERDLDFLR